jgi:hypothetical protein
MYICCPSVYIPHVFLEETKRFKKGLARSKIVLNCPPLAEAEKAERAAATPELTRSEEKKSSVEVKIVEKKTL